MPQRKYARRRRPAARRPARPAKYSTYKKKPVYNRRNRMPRSGVVSPFPTVMYRKLAYTDDTLRLVQGAGDTCAYIEYRGNSLNDPDLTGVGNQPRYYDTLVGAAGGTAPYRSYNVLASKIIVDIYQDPAAAGAAQNCTVFVIPNRGTTLGDNLPTTLLKAMETPYTRKKEIGLNTSWKPQRLTAYMKSNVMFGTKDGMDNEYSATYNGNPSFGWKWSIGICNIVPAQISSVYIRVSMKFYCQFSLQNEIATS